MWWSCIDTCNSSLAYGGKNKAKNKKLKHKSKMKKY
jgi:hypothetical protein